MKNLKNKYYLLRHGRNIHQTELKDIVTDGQMMRFLVN
jgi:hypothetical protein